ncbi:unnamed protein product [Echinostoma caproni]|uniref:NifU_N domain-containing protein n=1 Tax=Echinostoma caproni TaxID=27848 RepID=A0A183A2D7_9TREM|nr:unnamed protein product [Echinostoma caproni]
MQAVAKLRGLRVPLYPKAVVALGYHKNVIDHYENPRNVGSLDKKDKRVGTGLVGAPACGDVMKLQIKLGVETMFARASSTGREFHVLHTDCKRMASAVEMAPFGVPISVDAL